MSDIRTIRVFIASPGDLVAERRAFREVIEELNAGFANAVDVKFEALGCEDTLASTGRRLQDVINREIDRCDVFILAMHRRWGQAAPDSQPYSSYTEEEFHRAMARWQKKRRRKPHAPEIFVFFKHIDSASMADAGPQLQKVLDFRKSLEESHQVLYHGFANAAEFKAEVDRHLRAFAKGELPKADTPRDKDESPVGLLQWWKKPNPSSIPPPSSTKSVSVSEDVSVSDGATKPIVEHSPVMFDSGVLGGGSLGSSVMGGEGIPLSEPSGKHHHAPLKVYVDAGAADQATIRDLFLALSAVYEAHGGSGLTVTKHRQRTLVGEEVPV